MKKLAEELRTTLKCFISLTYNCTDEQQASIRETHFELTRLMNKFKASLLHEEGLLVRPEVRKNLKQSRQKNVLLPLHHNSQQKQNVKERRQMLHIEIE